MKKLIFVLMLILIIPVSCASLNSTVNVTLEVKSATDNNTYIESKTDTDKQTKMILLGAVMLVFLTLLIFHKYF